MSKKNLEQCRTAKDFIGYAEKHGARVENCTKGVKIFSEGHSGFALIHSNHPKELATGTRCALVKALIALGLAVLIPACMVIAKFFMDAEPLSYLPVLG